MLPEPLSRRGLTDEALSAQLEAVELFKGLIETNPAQFEPELALSLNILSKLFVEKGDITNGRAAAGEAAAILERLSQESPSRYEQDLQEAKDLAKEES